MYKSPATTVRTVPSDRHPAGHEGGFPGHSYFCGCGTTSGTPGRRSLRFGRLRRTTPDRRSVAPGGTYSSSGWPAVRALTGTDTTGDFVYAAPSILALFMGLGVSASWPRDANPGLQVR
jgi:hypothetical protein